MPILNCTPEGGMPPDDRALRKLARLQGVSRVHMVGDGHNVALDIADSQRVDGIAAQVRTLGFRILGRE